MKSVKKIACSLLILSMLGTNLGAGMGNSYAKGEALTKEMESLLETEGLTETESPKEEETLVETETPEETVPPEEKVIPEEAKTSEETASPEETETSEETKTPEETESPQETETEKPVTITVAAPEMKTAIVTTYNHVKVSWKKIKNADEYVLYKREKGKDKWSKVTKTKNDYYTVRDLVCGKNYQFTVQALKFKDEKTYKSGYGKNVVSAKPIPVSPKISLKSSTRKSATITWKPVKGATSYKVYYMKNGEWKKRVLVEADVLEYTWSGLMDESIQKLTVRAYHNDIGGSYDKTGFQIARKTPAVTMHSVKVSSGGKGSISWDPASEVDGYAIYRKDQDEDWKIVGYAAASKKSWSEKGLSNSKQYSYKVRGYRNLNDKKVKGVNGYSMTPTLTFSKAYVMNVKKTYIGCSAAGRKMLVFSVGTGSNHLNIISGLHAYEDEWNRDAKLLIKTSEAFLTSMSKSTGLLDNHDVTVNVISMANPDGYYDGYTCNGPGRCTTYRYNSSGTLVKGGVDMNRCFPVGFSPNYENRNYTGPNSLMCKEAKILASFINNWKGSGRNYFVDMHGWYNQIITRYKGSGLLYQGLHKYFPNSTPSMCAGQGYIMAYAYQKGYESALFEFPRDPKSETNFFNHKYDDKFIKSMKYVISNQ